MKFLHKDPETCSVSVFIVVQIKSFFELSCWLVVSQVSHIMKTHHLNENCSLDVTCCYCFTHNLHCPELPTLPDSAESSLNTNQSFHVLINEFENLPIYEKLFPIMLSVILNVSLIVVQNLPDCKMQYVSSSDCL